jgi:hypothetical protein
VHGCDNLNTRRAVAESADVVRRVLLSVLVIF